MAETIKENIKTKGLDDKISEVLVPMHEVTEVKEEKEFKEKKNIFLVMF